MPHKLSRPILYGLIIGSLLVISGSNAASGKEWRVADQTGKTIFSVDCKNVSYIGDGIYLSWNEDRSRGKLMNRNGKLLVVKLPEQYHFQELIIPPTEVQDAEGKIPDDALYIARKNGISGVFDRYGNPKIAAEYENFHPLDRYRYTATKFNTDSRLDETYIYDTHDNSIVKCPLPLSQIDRSADKVDVADRNLRIISQVKPDQNVWHGVVNERGETIIPCHSEQVEITESDRILYDLAIVGFDSEAWKDWENWKNWAYPVRSHSRSRVSLFAEFLRQYDLIGMSRPQVYKLLGPGEERGDIAQYTLESGPGQSADVTLRYDKKDCVIGWCSDRATAKDFGEHKWITENVKLVEINDFPGFSLTNLIPKSASLKPPG